MKCKKLKDCCFVEFKEPHLVVIILGVPTEPQVIVHVQVVPACRLPIDKVIVVHLHAAEPVHPLSVIKILASKVVVGAVLRVDGIEDALDPILLCLVGNVCQVGSVRSTLILGLGFTQIVKYFSHTNIPFLIGKQLTCWKVLWTELKM